MGKSQSKALYGSIQLTVKVNPAQPCNCGGGGGGDEEREEQGFAEYSAK